MKPASPLADLTDAFHTELDAGQQSALISWLAFTTTFAAVRGITYSIRAGKGPFGNLSVGGEHLHHYMWGIGLLAGVGGVAVHGEEKQRRHPLAAITYEGEQDADAEIEPVHDDIHREAKRDDSNPGQREV